MQKMTRPIYRLVQYGRHRGLPQWTILKPLALVSVIATTGRPSAPMARETDPEPFPCASVTVIFGALAALVASQNELPHFTSLKFPLTLSWYAIRGRPSVPTVSATLSLPADARVTNDPKTVQSPLRHFTNFTAFPLELKYATMGSPSRPTVSEALWVRTAPLSMVAQDEALIQPPSSHFAIRKLFPPTRAAR